MIYKQGAFIEACYRPNSFFNEIIEYDKVSVAYPLQNKVSVAYKIHWPTH